MGFGINIEDGSEVLPSMVVDQNSSSMELWDWQRRAIEYFLRYNKAIIEAATGTGKSYCAVQIIKEVFKQKPDAQVLIVVPKNVILEKTWYKELYDGGFSLVDIGVYYGAIKEYGKITITNMQNIHNIALEIFDMVIFDEIHNFGTTKLLEYLDYPFKYKLGLSATVTRSDGNHWKIMDIFDHNVFKYSPKDALNDGILNPFNFINIGVEMDDENFEVYTKLTKELNLMYQMGGGYIKIMKKNTPLKLRMLKKLFERKKLVSNYERKFDVVREIINKHRNDKVIVFNNYNQQTNKCYWHLLEIGIKARIIHSGIDKDKRDKTLTDFKLDKFQVLLTSRVLDEGFNLPKIDTAIIMAGDSTERQTIQRMGRVLRKKDKISNLYCKDTIEEQQSATRSKIFKELCSMYEQYIYDGENEIL